MCSAEIITPLIFSFRNGFKCFNDGDKTRGVVSTMQGAKVADAISQSPSVFGKVSEGAGGALGLADKGISHVAKALDKTEDLEKLITESGTKTAAGAIAGKLINPLLVASAGFRVLNDDDPNKALVEEGLAMGAMFGTEKLMKNAKNIFYSAGNKTFEQYLSAKNSKKTIGNVIKNALQEKIPCLKTAEETIYNQISSAGKKFGELTKNKQKAVQIGIGLAFVAGSILSYNTAKSIGKKITGRDKETEF